MNDKCFDTECPIQISVYKGIFAVSTVHQSLFYRIHINCGGLRIHLLWFDLLDKFARGSVVKKTFLRIKRPVLLSLQVRVEECSIQYTFHFLLSYTFNTLRPKRNGQHFSDVIFKYIYLNKNIWTSIKISLEFVPRWFCKESHTYCNLWYYCWIKILEKQQNSMHFVFTLALCLTKSICTANASMKLILVGVIEASVYKPIPLLRCFPWLCAWGCCTKAVGFIHIPGNLGFVFFTTV